MLSHYPGDWAVEGEARPYPPTIAPSPCLYAPTFQPAFQSDAQRLYSNLPGKGYEFQIPTETAANGLSIEITDCQYIGSYNWVSDYNNLSIIVPGSPREWQERSLPYIVPPDSQGHYREQYDRRMRSTPLLPLLLAVNHWHERTHPQPSKYPWHTVDFITNRNALRHLLRILCTNTNKTTGNSGGYGSGARRGKGYSRGNFNKAYPKPFRIDVELVGTKTILFNRWESTASEPFFVNSYGFNFESAFTREANAVSVLDPGETARHHRINSYDFGGLQMVVGSEMDACLPSTQPSPEGGTGASNNPTAQTVTPQSSSSGSVSTEFGLTIIPSQNPPTPQSHLIELSTIKTSTFPTWNAKERYPQLYFSQVPNLYLARHTEGMITQIDKRNLHTSPEILFYAPTVEPQLKKLRMLLQTIQSEVIIQERRSRGMRRSFSLVYLHGQLSLFERVGERCLPTEAFAMFDV